MLQDLEGTKRTGQHTPSNGRRLWYSLAGCPGKRGRAVGVSTRTTAQVDSKQGDQGITTSSTVSDVNSAVTESNIVDLYAVVAKSEEGGEKTKPFIHQIKLHRPQG